MHRKMFGSTKARVVGIVLSCLSLLGIGFGAASLASASSSSGLCATNGTRVVRYFASCPVGSFPIAFPAGTTYTVVAPPAPSPVKIVHKTVVVDATFQTGSVADRTVTLTGLPGYLSTNTEVKGDNTVDLPAGENITITPAAGTTGTSTVGATTRQFIITPTGFVGTKTFTLDLWVLAVAPAA